MASNGSRGDFIPVGTAEDLQGTVVGSARLTDAGLCLGPRRPSQKPEVISSGAEHTEKRARPVCSQ